MTSAARWRKSSAIAVILSGTRSNGAAGSNAIKAVGGLCIAEHPDGAKFPSMPRSLINSGNADAILEPAEMFDAIVRFATGAYATGWRGANGSRSTWGSPCCDRASATISRATRTDARPPDPATHEPAPTHADERLRARAPPDAR